MELSEFYLQNLLTAQEALEIEKTINDDGLKLKGMNMPDPVTMYQAYQTGKKIYDMFKGSGGGDGMQELMDYMKREFQLVKQLLNDVLHRLDELQIFIANEFRQLAVNNLSSILRIFNESYLTWRANPTDETVKAEAGSVLLKLREYNRNAQQYGFAHFHCIWLAVLYENSLLTLLQKPKDEIQRILNNHGDYFKDGVDTSIKGSLMNIYLQKLNSIKKLSEKFGSPIDYVSTYERQEGRYERTYRQILKITGSLYAGYSFDLKDPVVISEYFDGGSIAGGSHGGGGKALLNASISAAELNLGAIRKSYNVARNNYLKTQLPELNDCKLAVDTCQFYHDELRKMID